MDSLHREQTTIILSSDKKSILYRACAISTIINCVILVVTVMFIIYYSPYFYVHPFFLSLISPVLGSCFIIHKRIYRLVFYTGSLATLIYFLLVLCHIPLNKNLPYYSYEECSCNWSTEGLLITLTSNTSISCNLNPFSVGNFPLHNYCPFDIGRCTVYTPPGYTYVCPVPFILSNTGRNNVDLLILLFVDLVVLYSGAILILEPYIHRTHWIVSVDEDTTVIKTRIFSQIVNPDLDSQIKD
jgi:hypothetical protein